MSNGFHISEETPDRQYFTMVPNYIINHSTIWERDIYLIMKRIAGESGSCFASHETIAKVTGVSRPTISRTIKKLLKRGWIKEIGKVPGKTHPTKNYVIVDLWKQNIEYYTDQKKRKLQNQSTQNEKDTSTTEPKIRKPQIHKEEHIEEDNITKVILKPKGFGNSLVNLTLEEFKKVVGFYPTDKKPRWEANILIKQMTSALKRKLDVVPEERLEKAIKFYFNWISDKDWASGIQTLSTVRRKLPVFLAEYKL